MSYFTNFQDTLFSTAELSKGEKEKIDIFLQLLEDSGVGEIIYKETQRNKSLGGRNSYNPYRLFATIIYAFSKHSGSLRKIEESLKFDLRFMYINNQETPSYVTLSKFLNNVVVKHYEIIFSKITLAIINKYKLSIDDCFIDGTKIEANANKYKFVYKPTNFKINLFDKIKMVLIQYFQISENKKTFVSKEIAIYISQMLEMMKKQNIDIDTIKIGRGHRNPKIVSDYFLLSSYLIKLLDYEEKDEICGPNRNSYYKTDHDATAMCLKEDYYSGLGSNTHAAYNLQIVVSKGIILCFYVSQDRNDQYTLIPTLQKFYELYNFYPIRLCADAGYGSLKNYQFVTEKNIENYIKFGDWSRVVSGETYDLYHFNENGELICLNNKVALKTRVYENRIAHKGTYLYVIESCSYCRYKKYCQGNLKEIRTYRIFDTNCDYFKMKKQVTENLLSPKGIEMRVNRSSQAEGAFGVIKQDMDYERARRRGLENVSLEFMLTCLGYNIRKLFLLIEGKAKMDYWKAPDDLKPETIPPINYERILKKRKKGENESLRKSYKYKKRAVRN